MDPPWEVEYTDEFETWWNSLTRKEQDLVGSAVEKLAERGPTLGRPHADTLKGSRHSHLKELRPRRSNLRILFAMDPRRTAILLIGGDKTGMWRAWYKRMIPVADRLYDEYLDELREEGELL